MGVVYKATNTVTGKSYIGITTQEFENYKRRHITNALSNKDLDSRAFYRAIRKYGESCFEWEILNNCDDNDKLRQLEIYYIEKFGTYGIGYNETRGGDGFFSKHSEESKLKMSNSRKGVSHSSEWNKKVGEANRGKKHKPHSPESIAKQVVSSTGKLRPRYYGVSEIYLDPRYKEALDKYKAGENKWSGSDNPKFVALDEELVATLYRSNLSTKAIMKEYNRLTNSRVGDKPIRRVCNLLRRYEVNLQDDNRDVIFLDIDGTLVSHNVEPNLIPEHYLNGTMSFLMKNLDKAVVLITSRSEGHTIKVRKFLEANKVNVIGILSSLPTGKRILVNDHKPGESQKAIAINVIRDVGIEDVTRD